MSRTFLVAGLAYGDEGKGSTVDAIVRQTGIDLVIRYNGGAQCAHNVVLPNGKHHTFAQFGSGTFIPGTRTYLSRFVLVNPVSLMIEADALTKVGVDNIDKMMYVDSQCPIITPFQRAINRLEEISRGKSRHGSTGMGIGQTRSDHLQYGDAVLLAEDLNKPQRARAKLDFIRSLCREKLRSLSFPQSAASDREVGSIDNDSTIEWYLDKYLTWSKRFTVVSEPPTPKNGMVFEGGQGMLLDEKWGFQPHTTWTDISFNNAETILKEVGSLTNAQRVGVLRTYFTRHGAGLFPSECSSLKSLPQLEEPYNKGEEYTGEFRIGHFDLPMLLYSLHAIGGVDMFAINHLDVAQRLGTVGIRIANREVIQLSEKSFVPMLKEMTRIPIGILGYGPSCKDKEFDLQEEKQAYA